jgi:cysteinyl-tRNA synthetase
MCGARKTRTFAVILIKIRCILFSMPLRLYDTLSKTEKELSISSKGKVSMYTCGPTVYGRPHIGNYSSFLMADLLRRWLEIGHKLKVSHVKNITDVGHLLHDADSGDDKIQKEAEKEKLHPLEIAKRYTDQYLADEKALNMLEPEARPRASEYVKEMLEIIRELLRKKNAYETADGIYFDVNSKTPTPYGTLSGNTLENLTAGARVDVNDEKKHPADFALWKKCVGENGRHILRWRFDTGERADGEGEDAGAGFPGWHIECSAMSRALLGDQIDLHTGGEDNIFPHHECEIAQSEAFSGKKPFVAQWLHKRRIDLAGAKMSKSLGNIVTLDSVIEQGFSPQDLRYYLLSVHYRTNLKFSWKGLEDAHKARRKILEWMDEVAETSGKGTQRQEEFTSAMDGDLNTPAALASIFEAMNDFRTGKAGDYAAFARMVRDTFGCFEKEQEGIPTEVQKLVDLRAKARAEKNFAESDRLRDEIKILGYEVRDSGGQQTIKKL